MRRRLRRWRRRARMAAGRATGADWPGCRVLEVANPRYQAGSPRPPSWPAGSAVTAGRSPGIGWLFRSRRSPRHSRRHPVGSLSLVARTPVNHCTSPPNMPRAVLNNTLNNTTTPAILHSTPHQLTKTVLHIYLYIYILI